MLAPLLAIRNNTPCTSLCQSLPTIFETAHNSIRTEQTRTKANLSLWGIAGLTNAVWLQPGAAVLQLVPYGWQGERDDFYPRAVIFEQIALNSGCHYLQWVNQDPNDAYFLPTDFPNRSQYVRHPDASTPLPRGRWLTDTVDKWWNYQVGACMCACLPADAAVCPSPPGPSSPPPPSFSRHLSPFPATIHEVCCASRSQTGVLCFCGPLAPEQSPALTLSI